MPTWVGSLGTLGWSWDLLGWWGYRGMVGFVVARFVFVVVVLSGIAEADGDQDFAQVVQGRAAKFRDQGVSCVHCCRGWCCGECVVAAHTVFLLGAVLVVVVACW